MSTEEIPDGCSSECCYSLCCNSSKPKTPWQKMMRVQLICFPIVILFSTSEIMLTILEPALDNILQSTYCICEIIIYIIGFVSLFIFKTALLSTVKYGNITLSIAAIPMIIISFISWKSSGGMNGSGSFFIVVLIYASVCGIINLFLFFLSKNLLKSEAYQRKCGIFQDVDQSNLIGDNRNTDSHQIYYPSNTSHVEYVNNVGIFSQQYPSPVYNNYPYQPNIPQPSNFPRPPYFNMPIPPDKFIGQFNTSNDVPVDQIFVESNQDHDTTTDNYKQN